VIVTRDGATRAAAPRDARSADRDRYRRQKLLPWLGDTGQARLERAGVLVTRVGGLGGPVVQSLALAGIRRLVFYHPGVLLEEDLHRMVLMMPGRIGEARAPQAEASIRRLRGDLDVRGFDRIITPDEAARWMHELDLAIGAAPTFEERLVLHDAALAAGKPYVDAAMHADEVQVLCVRPGGPCLRCLLPEPPPWNDDFPVLGAVSALAGNLAAALAVRILAGRTAGAAAGGVPWGEVLHLDVQALALRRIPLARRAGCLACGVRHALP
jgi:adenylyltransferase/sulfurtransferase